MAPQDAIISLLPITEPTSTLTARKDSKVFTTVSTRELEDGTCTPRGHRRASEPRTSVRCNKNGNPLTLVARIYAQIQRYPIVIRHIVYALPLGTLLAIPIVAGHTAAPDARVGHVPLALFFAWLEIMWVSFWVTRLFVYCAARLVKGLCGIISAGLKKYADVVCALERPLTLCVWLVICYLTLFPVLNGDVHHSIHHDENSEMWQRIVHRIQGALLSCSLILLGERTLIQYVSIDYHRKQFEAKIRETKAGYALLGQLYEVSRKRNPEFEGDFAECDQKIQDVSDPDPQIMEPLGPARSEAASPFSRFALRQVARELAGKNVSAEDRAHSIITQALENPQSTTALAHRLWMSFALPDQTALSRADFAEILGSERFTVAENAFDLLDRDGNEDITFEELKLAIARWGQDRKSINKSIHDVDHAIQALDGMLVVVVFLLSIVVFVAFLDPGFYDGLSKYYAGLMSASWLFAATVQEILGSCVFIFVKHPYDILDRVDINKDALVVEQISLLFTVFRRVSDSQRVQIPNIVLNSAFVHNVSRSPPMRERLAFKIHAETSQEDLALLQAELEAFVRAPKQCRDFQHEVSVEATLAPELGALELAVDFGHRSNLANEPLRLARHRAFSTALLSTVRAIPIYAPAGGDATLGDLAKPNYTVAVSHEQSLEQREKFKEEKNAKRKVPHQGTNEGRGVSTGLDIQ